MNAACACSISQRLSLLQTTAATSLMCDEYLCPPSRATPASVVIEIYVTLHYRNLCSQDVTLLVGGTVSRIATAAARPPIHDDARPHHFIINTSSVRSEDRADVLRGATSAAGGLWC